MNENRFNGKANVYTEARPDYPMELLDTVFKLFHKTTDITVADIGSGTGKLTADLLKRGCTVYAVEPNSDMRSAAENSLSCFTNFKSINACAEKTSLLDRSIDLITVAQAFHWFDVSLFKTECRRILKDGGKILLVWNLFDNTTKNGKEYEGFLKNKCPGYKGFGGGYESNINKIKDFFNGEFLSFNFQRDFIFDKSALIKRALSSSYAPRKEDANYNDFITSLSNFFDTHKSNDTITFSNLTNAYCGSV